MYTAILTLVMGFQAPVELPPEVKGQPGTLIVVKATTPATDIKFLPLTPGLQVLDASLLKDPTTFVCTSPKPGIWKLVAYSENGQNAPTGAFTVIKIGDYKPDPDNPNPPKPPVPPQPNKLAEQVTALYGADVDPGKNLYRDGFSAGFSQVLVSLDGVKTVGELNEVVKKSLAGRNNPDADHPNRGEAVRNVIRDYLTVNFGIDPNAELDKEKAKKVFTDIITALGGCK